jgi:hypothetical protein
LVAVVAGPVPEISSTPVRSPDALVPDWMKSLLAGGVLVFVCLVVLDGEILRRGVTFCHHFEDTLLLAAVPCFLIDFVVGFGTLLLLMAAVVLIVRTRR